MAGFLSGAAQIAAFTVGVDVLGKKFPGRAVFVPIEEDDRAADLVTAVWGAAKDSAPERT